MTFGVKLQFVSCGLFVETVSELSVTVTAVSWEVTTLGQ